jgi:hypothetical protein
MSRFTVAKALKGNPISFVSKYDAAIDWPGFFDKSGNLITPERFDSERSEHQDRVPYKYGMEPAIFIAHAPSEREFALALAAAGIDFDERKMPILAGMEGVAGSALALSEFWFHLGRFCVDDCPSEKGLIELEGWRRISRVTDACLKAHPELEQILAELGCFLQIEQGKSSPNS